MPPHVYCYSSRATAPHPTRHSHASSASVTIQIECHTGNPTRTSGCNGSPSPSKTICSPRSMRRRKRAAIRTDPRSSAISPAPGCSRDAEDAAPSGQCVAALVYVYDHAARDLSKRLVQNFHGHHDLSLATLHVHLDDDSCMEVTALKGASGEVRHFADHIIAERGVRYGRVVMIPTGIRQEAEGAQARPSPPLTSGIVEVPAPQDPSTPRACPGNITSSLRARKGLDGRDKPGHDDKGDSPATGRSGRLRPSAPRSFRADRPCCRW